MSSAYSKSQFGRMALGQFFKTLMTIEMKRRKIGRKLLLEEKVLVHLLQLLLLGGL
jgi:hypothetical protein